MTQVSCRVLRQLTFFQRTRTLTMHIYLCDIESNVFTIRLEADNNEAVLWCIPFAL